ncbi:MAG: hypothetical protein M3P30_04730 [Chloroflexota bacterium]|nr:hypothetical protein [Chloroflexota bacterium]
MKTLLGSVVVAALVLGSSCGGSSTTSPKASPSAAAPVATTATKGCPQGCTASSPGCVIKGNISTGTGEKIYHVPGGQFYAATIIDPSQGERWFCTAQEAVANGWRASLK